MSNMSNAEIQCREVMEELITEGIDENVLGRNLWAALSNVIEYRNLAVSCKDPANRKHYSQEAERRERVAIDMILNLRTE